MFTQVAKISEKIHSKAFIQKIYSSSFYISIALRLAGETVYLCIGRGAGKEGVWLDEQRVDASLRKIDKFLEYLRKHLSGSTFLSLEVDTQDRIFCIKYAKWGRENFFYFFYNARNMYFANVYYDDKFSGMRLFKSWYKKVELYEGGGFDLFDEVGRIELPDKEDEEKQVISITKLFNEEKKIALSSSLGGKGHKFFKRKEKNIKDDLEKVSKWPELQEIAATEKDFSQYPQKMNFSMTTLKFKEKDHYKRRDEVFLKVKKLKKAQGILTLRYEDTHKNIKDLSTKVAVENNLKIIHPIWYTPKKEMITSINKGENDYRVYTFDNYDVGLGQTASGNDQLRKNWASKEDLWFHLDGDKSAHAIVKMKTGALDKAILDVVGSIIIDASKVNYTEANLVYTPVKNIKGVKGAAGKVTFKKEKRIVVHYNADWRSLIN